MVIIIVIVIIAGAHLNSTPVPTHDYFYLVYFITDYSATIGGLKENGPQRECDLVGVGGVSLEEMSHCGVRL